MTDVWPRTGRWLPWLVASFLVVAWLVPIDSITLRGFSAFDLKLDRILIAVVGFVWLLSLCAGGKAAPRLRGMGPVGLAVVAFGLIGMFSVVSNLHVLLEVGDSDLATRKLVLLGSYVLLFLVVATSLRPQEVEAMARLFLWLGAICAAGVVYHRLQGTNPFFWVADHALPKSGFSLREVATSPRTPDPISGPSRHPLGAAGMLSMAVPFALVEVLHATGRRRVVHALVFVLLLAGVFATNRKTGIFASVATLGFLTVVQPRAMVIRALPYIALGLLLITALKPHAVEFQLTRLAPGNVTKGASSQGRTADYPAIVPDFRQHPALGRGWGSYDPLRYRILDNNYLVMLLEVGVIGIAAFAASLFSVWAMARRLARSIPARAGPALAAAAGTVAFGVSMALFDAFAFPQTPYFFFFLAGLVSVLWREVAEVEPVPVVAVATA